MSTVAAPRARAQEPTPGGAPVSAVKSILDLIQDRRLQPGDRLPSERDLAERLGMGRNALREGITALTTLRVLESRPNSGIYLRRLSTDSSFETLAMLAELGSTPSPTEIAESTEVRQALETLAVELACVRRTEDDLERLEAIALRTERLLAEGGNIVEQDTEFHLALVAATHNSVLVRVLHSFYRMTAARRSAWFGNQAQGRHSARDHRRLLQAVAARDAGEARRLMDRHMARAMAYWKQVLE